MYRDGKIAAAGNWSGSRPTGATAKRWWRGGTSRRQHADARETPAGSGLNLLRGNLGNAANIWDAIGKGRPCEYCEPGRRFGRWEPGGAAFSASSASRGVPCPRGCGGLDCAAAFR